MNGEFVSSLPAGYRFKPRDEELVDFYLKRKIYNKPLPPNIFRDVDLYDHDPYILTEIVPPPQRLSNQDMMQLDDWVLCRVYTKKEQRLKHGTTIQGSCDKLQEEVNVQALKNDILSLVQYQEEVLEVQVLPLQLQFPDFNQIQPLQQQLFSRISAPFQYQGSDAMSIPQQQQVLLQLQLSGVDQSQPPQRQPFLEISLPDQYQELDTDVFNMLIPQQQQLPPLQQHFSDVNQSQPLQQQQFSESEISPLDQFLQSLNF
ncbi:hypothetical protein V6N13_135086 [Hibiscus sabdariffa]